MKTIYQVAKPADFTVIISDLLQWSENNPAINLVLALKGDLGAGKTTFTQEFARVLGVTETVNSPTFTIIKQYELSHPQFDTLVHMDAYRLESQQEVGPLRLEELFSQPRTVVCVEWPEIIIDSIPETAVWLEFETVEDEARTVTVKMGAEDSVTI
ncbi:MAG: hypothetical protein RLZZ230_10 [Candidatus Parcubacteria bacterium]|jgi:tRNA threonylcarbamoyladenosine biosynthesis protein TsaE